MKKNYLLFSMMLLAGSAFAQKDNVGIGTTKPDQSAVLDVSSTNKGLLMPRLTLEKRNAIQNPAQGLIVYQTDMLSGFYFYDGKEWKSLTNTTSANSVAGIDGDWIVGGNYLLPVSGDKYIGTNDASPLQFKVDGLQSGLLDLKNNTFFGRAAGVSASLSGEYNVGLGYAALNKNTTGQGNVAIGTAALTNNLGGASNLAIGTDAMNATTAGFNNVAIGNNALRLGTSPSRNLAFGTNALKTTNGDDNIGIGNDAGQNATGSRNLFIGKSSGENETGSDKLYISSSNTIMPLIYGDFSAKFISIGDVGVAGDPVATAAKRNSLASQYGLLVQKGILTEKIKVATMTSTDWADYVFENDYKVMPLEAVEAFVKENKHLPNVPTTSEMMSSGNDLMKTDAKLLEKIEELTLYMIEMNKEIKALKAENAKLKNK